MKYIIFFLFIVGCASAERSYQRIGIVHDYIFYNATKICVAHEGLHYIVSVINIESKRSERSIKNVMHDDYPCDKVYKIRCQDGTLHDFYDGVGYCFISESQLQDTLEGKSDK